jgi:hypothetical protein
LVLGTELKEQFEARAGQEESYVGGGAQSFPDYSLLMQKKDQTMVCTIT